MTKQYNKKEKEKKMNNNEFLALSGDKMDGETWLPMSVSELILGEEEYLQK